MCQSFSVVAYIDVKLRHRAIETPSLSLESEYYNLETFFQHHSVTGGLGVVIITSSMRNGELQQLLPAVLQPRKRRSYRTLNATFSPLKNWLVAGDSNRDWRHDHHQPCHINLYYRPRDRSNSTARLTTDRWELRVWPIQPLFLINVLLKHQF